MTVTRDLDDAEKRALNRNDRIQCPHHGCTNPIGRAELIEGVVCSSCGGWVEFSLFYGGNTEDDD